MTEALFALGMSLGAAPAKLWKDMDEKERERVRTTTLPPRGHSDPTFVRRERKEEAEPVEVACIRKLHETDMAIRVLLTEGGRNVWIPRSVIVGDPDELDDGSLFVHVKPWFAAKEGLV